MIHNGLAVIKTKGVVKYSQRKFADVATQALEDIDFNILKASLQTVRVTQERTFLLASKTNLVSLAFLRPKHRRKKRMLIVKLR